MRCAQLSPDRALEMSIPSATARLRARLKRYAWYEFTSSRLIGIGILLRAPMWSPGFWARWDATLRSRSWRAENSGTASPYLPSPQSLLASLALSSSPSLGSERISPTARAKSFSTIAFPALRFTPPFRPNLW